MCFGIIWSASIKPKKVWFTELNTRKLSWVSVYSLIKYSQKNKNIPLSVAEKLIPSSGYN